MGGVNGGSGGAGYQRDSEVLDLEKMTWTVGPETPNGDYLNGAVAVPHEKSFLLIGGTYSGREEPIFQLEPRSMTWIEREETLVEYRLDRHFVAVHLTSTAEKPWVVWS